jgi:hypothetical protein
MFCFSVFLFGLWERERVCLLLCFFCLGRRERERERERVFACVCRCIRFPVAFFCVVRESGNFLLDPLFYFFVVLFLQLGAYKVGRGPPGNPSLAADADPTGTRRKGRKPHDDRGE